MLEAFFSMVVAGAGPGATVETVTDRLPEGVPASVLPEGAAVLGGVRFGTGERVTAVAFARLDAGPEGASEAFASATLADGWAVEPDGPARFGFKLCAPDRSADALFAARGRGGSYFSVAVEDDPCGRDIMIGEEVVVEPVDVLGDGEIIDEPAEVVTAIESPALPALSLDGVASTLVASMFDYDAGPDGRDEYRGAYGRALFPALGVSDAAGAVTTQLQSDAWVQLGSHEVDGVAVSAWIRTEGGRTAVLQVAVRPHYDGAEVYATVTQ